MCLIDLDRGHCTMIGVHHFIIPHDIHSSGPRFKHSMMLRQSVFLAQILSSWLLISSYHYREGIIRKFTARSFKQPRTFLAKVKKVSSECESGLLETNSFGKISLKSKLENTFFNLYSLFVLILKVPHKIQGKINHPPISLFTWTSGEKAIVDLWTFWKIWTLFRRDFRRCFLDYQVDGETNRGNHAHGRGMAGLVAF